MSGVGDTIGPLVTFRKNRRTDVNGRRTAESKNSNAYHQKAYKDVYGWQFCLFGGPMGKGMDGVREADGRTYALKSFLNSGSVASAPNFLPLPPSTMFQ